MTETFRPLYETKEKISLGNTGNKGLEFDKFGSAWKKAGETYEFDKGADNEKSVWLKTFAKKTCGDSKQIEEAVKRQ